MDARVSARVPVETRERADKQLKRIGATQTQLINAAYEYVIETGELPHASDAELPERHVGTLSDVQTERLRERLAQTTCHVPSSFFSGRTDDEILGEELGRGYEALT